MSESSIRVSEALMAELQKAADVEQRSPQEVVEDAVERHLCLRRRERLYAYGEGHGERLGLEEQDVPALVKEIRRIHLRAVAKCPAADSITGASLPGALAGALVRVLYEAGESGARRSGARIHTRTASITL